MLDLTRAWRPGRTVDVHRTLNPLRRGAGDPAYRVSADGAVWRGTRTPEGPGTLRLGVRRRDGVVEATAWGAGATWLLDSVPSLLGEDDDATGFVPRHPLLRAAAARHTGWRVCRTGLVLEAVVPAVLEQKVTSVQARRAWRSLLRRHGEPAPGPVPEGLTVPPDARGWAGVPSWEWHRGGVEPARSRTVVAAARVADALERTAAVGAAEADRVLQAIPGIGAWTSAEVRQRAHGDADAVSVGDFHIPAMVGWALAGRRVDDTGMLDLLRPYAGHRYRVTELIAMSGARPERRGPRLTIADHRHH